MARRKAVKAEPAKDELDEFIELFVRKATLESVLGSQASVGKYVRIAELLQELKLRRQKDVEVISSTGT